MTDRRTVWIILLAAVALRLVIAARIPLVDDEAYYWAWSRHLAWGYPDHPPAIAGLIRATTALLGDGPLGVRAGPILLQFGIAVLLYDLGRRMFGAEVGALAALWFQAIPLVSIGGMLAFPDAPFIFFWVLTMWALWRARGQDGMTWWLLTGAATGLAALSKFAAIFLGIAAAGYLVWGERHQRWWRRPQPYAAAAVAMALIIPMLWWNADHNGAMIEKARDPYVWIKTAVPALNALVYAGAQLLYYGPVAAALLIAALAAAWRGTRAVDQRYVYALWMAIPLLGVFAAVSFDGVAKPHWTAPAYLVALLVGAAQWTELRRRPWWRTVVTAAVGVNVALTVALGAFVVWPGTSAAGELHAWPPFMDQLRRALEATPETPGRFILVPDYQTAAQIEYHLPGLVVALPYGLNAFRIWVPDQRLIDWNAVYVAAADEQAPRAPLGRMFKSVEALPPITLGGEAQTFRTYVVYRGLRYRGFPRPAAPIR